MEEKDCVALQLLHYFCTFSMAEVMVQVLHVPAPPEGMYYVCVPRLIVHTHVA